MRRRKGVFQKILSVLLSFALSSGIVLTAMPMEAWATEDTAIHVDAETPCEIVAFAELPEEIKQQYVAVGTPLEKLELPNTLTVSYLFDAEVLEETENPKVSGNDAGAEAESEKEDGETGPNGEASSGAETVQETVVVPMDGYQAESDHIAVNTLTASDPEHTFEYAEKEIEGITWISTPEYDGELEESYVFTPILPEGYRLSEGGKPPEITVMVEEVKTLALSEAVPAAGSTTPDIGVISDGTIWTDGQISKNGTITINEGDTLTITGKVTINGDITIEGGGTILRGNTRAYFDIPSSDSSITLRDITVDGQSLETLNSMITVNGGTVTLEDGCTIMNCSVGTLTTHVYGAAVRVIYGGNAILKGAVITGCSAQSGGAISMHDSTAIICDTDFTNCSARGNGGAISMYNTPAVISDTEFTNCSAGYSGGAIDMSGSTSDISKTSYISGTKFTKCSAENDGGAIYMSNLTADISDAEFTKCYTETNGGAIRMGNVTADISDTEFTSCSAHYGGAIYMRRNSNVNLQKDTIEDCEATDSGGAIYNYEGSVLNIHSGTYRNNKTTSTVGVEGTIGGGFIYTRGSELTVKGGSFIGNKAANKGGCIHHCGYDNTNTYLYGGYFANNTCTYEKYRGSGGVFVSSVAVGTADIYIAGDAHFVGDGNDLGTDGIYLDQQKNKPRKIWIRNTLSYPLTIYVKAVKDYVIAEGSDYTLLENRDLNKIRFVNVEDSEKQWYAVLDKDTNQIKLSTTEPPHIDKYFVYYISNGADGTVRDGNNDDNGYDPNTTIKVQPADDLNWPNHTFIEWNTQPDGSGASYHPGDDLTMKSDVYLYAIFSAVYRVEHYRQDLVGNAYSIVVSDTQELEAAIGSTVTAASKEYPGFTENTTHRLRKGSGKVTADGSLVLALYYDRNVYHISFDLNGGSGETPKTQAVLYGNCLQEPQDAKPVRDGFVFGGWYKDKEGTDVNQWIFENTVEDNTTELSTTLYAKWIENNFAVYTVEHYQQNKDGDGYSIVDDDTQYLPGIIGSTVTAIPKDYPGFTENTTHELRKASDEVTKDGKLVLALYYDRNVYNITFDLNGGSGETPKPQTVLYGNYLRDPQGVEPAIKAFFLGNWYRESSSSSGWYKDGFSFGGWYKDREGTDGNQWIFGKTVEDNTTGLSTTLYAKWIKDDNDSDIEKGDDDESIEPTPTPTQTSTTFETDTVNKFQNRTEPKTGVPDYTRFFATMAMISGLSYTMVLFLEEYGMTESEKNALVARLIRWAKQAGPLRRLLALATIFLLLIYYHSIGKQKLIGTTASTQKETMAMMEI
ncbi:MAG: InlB B-repeat-containing protein [Acetatifactor sp.]|nr:InlB B-repeat-containing protein [Acetatifactor sp.]